MIDEYTERTKKLRQETKERRAMVRINEIKEKMEFGRLVKELRRTREEK